MQRRARLGAALMAAAGLLAPSDFADLALAAIRDRQLNPATLALVSEDITHLATFLDTGLGVQDMRDVEEDHLRAFIWSRQLNGSEPEYARRRIRRLSIRMAYRAGRALGIVEGDPSVDIDIGRPSHVHAGPISDEAIELARSYAARSRSDRRRSVAWALTEATGRTGEIGYVRPSDLDMSDGTVGLRGTSIVDPRRGRLTGWGLRQIEQRLRSVMDQDESLIVWRSTPRSLEAACRQAIVETLRESRLLSREIKPRSVIAWAGRKAFDEGASIDAVARMLGMRSLDATAAFIGLDWRTGA